MWFLKYIFKIFINKIECDIVAQLRKPNFTITILFNSTREKWCYNWVALLERFYPKKSTKPKLGANCEKKLDNNQPTLNVMYPKQTHY